MFLVLFFLPDTLLWGKFQRPMMLRIHMRNAVAIRGGSKEWICK